jgi:hypothetical protein
MKIGNYEVECDDHEMIALKFFMGAGTESVEDWVARVKENCDLYQKNLGFDDEGNRLPPVFARSFEDLWKEKRQNRKKALIKELLHKEVKTLPEEVQALSDCKVHPDYITQDERFEKEEEEYRKQVSSVKKSQIAKIKTLKAQGLKEETIKVLCPELEHHFESAVVSTVKSRGKK